MDRPSQLRILVRRPFLWAVVIAGVGYAMATWALVGYMSGTDGAAVVWSWRLAMPIWSLLPVALLLTITFYRWRRQSHDPLPDGMGRALVGGLVIGGGEIEGGEARCEGHAASTSPPGPTSPHRQPPPGTHDDDPFRQRLTALSEVTNTLSCATSLEELYRDAVELGRTRLGLGRVGLWLVAPEGGRQEGTFGTDEAGRLRDERGYVRPIPEEHQALLSAREPQPVRYEPDAGLRDVDLNVVGRGERARAAIWDGHRHVGFLVTDNLLDGRTIDAAERELLNLYAASIGHLMVRLGTEQALREAHEELEQRVEERTREVLHLEARWRALAGTAPGFIIFLSPTGAIRYVNRSWSDQPADALIGTAMADHLEPAARATMEDCFRNVLDRGDYCSFEASLVGSPAGPVPHEFRVGPSVAGGEVAGLTLIGTDLSQRKWTEETVQIQRDLALRLGSTRRLEEALDLVLDAALQLESIDAGGVYSADESSGALVLVAHRNLSEAFLEHARYHGPESPNVALVQPGKPFYLRVSEMSLSGDALAAEGVRFFGCIPILYKGKMVAVLNLGTCSQNTIPQRVCHAIETIAAQIGGVIARLRVEAALSESEARMRTLLDNLPLDVWLVDLAGRFTMQNATSRRWWGELVGRSIDDLALPPGLHERWRRQLARAICGEVVREEMDVHRDGAKRTLSAIVTAVCVEGKTSGVLGVAMDLTERKRAERELQRRDRILETIAFTLEGFLRSGTWEEAAPTVMAKMGQSLDLGRVHLFENGINAQGQRVSRHRFEWTAPGVPPTLRERVLSEICFEDCGFAPYESQLERGELVHGPTVSFEPQTRNLISLSGTRSIVFVPILVNDEWWGSLTFDDVLEARRWSPAEIETLRTAAGIWGAALERFRTEGQLRDSEALFRQMAENVQEVLWVCQVEPRRMLYMSPAWADLSGRPQPPLDTLPEGIEAVVHEKDRARLRDLLDRLFSGQRVSEELRLVTPDGSVRWVWARGFPIYDAQGKLQRVAGIGEDMTDRKLAQEADRRRLEDQALVARVNTMGEMASGLAHELNQPLAAIANYAETGLQRLGTERWEVAAVIEDLELIARQAERAGKVIHRLRDFVRRGTGPQHAVDVNQLVRDAVDFQRVEVQRRGVTIELALAEDLPTLFADPIQIEQVLLNLLHNSFDAMAGNAPEHRRVQIATRYGPGESVEVAVRDNGPGLADEARGRLFEQFFSTKPDGLGLGLSISQSIIEAHAGRLWLEASSADGATFCFSLPLQERGVSDEP